MWYISHFIFRFKKGTVTLGGTEYKWNGAADVVRDRVAAVLKGGGRVFMCANTANVVGFTQDDLIDGFEMAKYGATVLIAQLQDAGFSLVRP